MTRQWLFFLVVSHQRFVRAAASFAAEEGSGMDDSFFNATGQLMLLPFSPPLPPRAAPTHTHVSQCLSHRLSLWVQRPARRRWTLGRATPSSCASSTTPLPRSVRLSTMGAALATATTLRRRKSVCSGAALRVNGKSHTKCFNKHLHVDVLSCWVTAASLKKTYVSRIPIWDLRWNSDTSWLPSILHHRFPYRTYYTMARRKKTFINLFASFYSTVSKHFHSRI